MANKNRRKANSTKKSVNRKKVNANKRANNNKTSINKKGNQRKKNKNQTNAKTRNGKVVVLADEKMKKTSNQPQNRGNDKKEKEKNKWVKWLLLLLLLISVSVGTALVISDYYRDKLNRAAKEADLTPDIAPDEDENAESLGDGGADKMDQPKGGGAVNITFTKDVVADLSKKEVAFNFSNPSKSNQDMVIQVQIKDNIVMQTGTLSPGNQIKKARLLDTVKLSPGIYKDSKFKVLYYYRDTGKRAVVDTDIPIEVKVQR
jgi:hypothetical protein